MDFLGYYNLESYLFNTVRQRFHDEGHLSAFDFFSIVIWKANRAKSRIARRLLEGGHSDLEQAVVELTSSLARQPTAKERLHDLWAKWGLRLPMASAILTVLYPDEFTVYDYRLCEQLGDFHNLPNRSNFDELWRDYQALLRRVREVTPDGLSLRDRDRYLWGKSAVEQLRADLEREFNTASTTGAANEHTEDPMG
jgi:hypothetical protein